MCESLLGRYNEASTTPLHTTFIVLLLVESLIVTGVSLWSSHDSVSSSRRHGTTSSAIGWVCYSINVIDLQLHKDMHQSPLAGRSPAKTD